MWWRVKKVGKKNLGRRVRRGETDKRKGRLDGGQRKRGGSAKNEVSRK